MFRLKDVGQVRQYPLRLTECRLLIGGLKGELVSPPHHLNSSLYQALQFRFGLRGETAEPCRHLIPGDTLHHCLIK